ncbi:MAG: phosphotransferase [candidate division WOR-3 bacterium]|nr:MAG: phosphotransferase [candidate division WOR-3 bacterium]
MKDKKNYILVKDKDIRNYLKLQKHLERRGIGVPQIYEIDEKKHTILMEDLGEESLYALVRKKKRNILRLYRMAIRELIKIQVDAYPRVPVNVYYDHEHISWEQDYFRTFFLHQFCGIPEKKLNILDSDFRQLARTLLEEAKRMTTFLMHRDYQSQNIFIKNGRIRIIDFQSARVGPLTYDLAALLKDAYVHISKKWERILVDYYLYCLKKKGVQIKKNAFLNVYHLSGLQRNMQALGAFAYLSLKKKKNHFRQHIPRGLQLLQSGLKNAPFQHLSKIVNDVVGRFY